MNTKLQAKILKHCTYFFSRSGGKGGQHVNKTETKVQLVFNLLACDAFDSDQKQLIQDKVKSKLDAEGNVHLESQKTRSQLKNKEDVQKRLFNMIEKALQRPKKRKPTKPGKAQKEQRIKEKKIRAQVKESRRKPDV